MKEILIFLSALISPLILLPIEKLFPYPHIVEELTKALIIILILKLPGKTSPLKLTILAGFLFSLSESLFYLGDAFSSGYSFLFAKKLFLIFFLHLSTLLLFLFSLSNAKKLLIVSLPIAILLHFIFNQIF